MESSQVVGADAQKWSGSESGWTMYISSPNIHSESTNDVYHYTSNDHQKGGEKSSKKKAILDYDDDESDDSMASDASSGPSHQHAEVLLPCGTTGDQGGRSRRGRLRHAAKEELQGDCKRFSGKKMGKKRDERLRVKEEKEELMHKADSAASHV